MDSFTENDINEAIKNALELAERNGVRGKEITPFLLSKISKITKGRSLDTSILFENIFLTLAIVVVTGSCSQMTKLKT